VSNLFSAFILFITVLAGLGVGILAGYWAVNGILFAFAYQTRAELRRQPILAVSQTNASGD
jgi:hypothetical protein